MRACAVAREMDTGGIETERIRVSNEKLQRMTDLHDDLGERRFGREDVIQIGHREAVAQHAFRELSVLVLRAGLPIAAVQEHPERRIAALRGSKSSVSSRRRP